MSILPSAESKWSNWWWWDSPMNSKWLYENMKDVKIKVREMFKLIEEDADSFAWRPEMYYNKQPKLMKLVNELYRAYLAVAERYDHATRTLHHARQRLSEPFPNHVPLALMTLKSQNLFENVKEMEHCKVGLEDEIRKLQDMNSILNEHNSECALKITHLEADMISLKEINCKLEDEVEIHVERRKVLQQEHESLKNDKNEIDLKHQSLTKEMEYASLRAEFLGTLVKKLQSDYNELEEYCRELQGEKLMFLDKMKDVESVSKRNSALENSLSEANIEIEELKEQINVLEGSCESINAVNSAHIGEKAVLASDVEILVENLEKLSRKSTLLESSLDCANTELKELRWSLKVFEELDEFLYHENLKTVDQKKDLLSQVERLKQILGNLETKHASLEEEKLNLINEKDLSANKILQLENSLSVLQKEHEKQPRLVQENRQVNEELEATHQRCFSHLAENIILQSCLYDTSNSWIIEKQKCTSLIHSKEIQLSDLESQIQFLREEIKVRDCKLEEEEQKSMNSKLEMFILHECLSEMEGGNFSVLLECQKLQEASRSANVLIKELEGRDAVQKQNIGLLMEKLTDLENENVRLKTNLKELSPLFSSAGNEISDVEEHAQQLAKLHGNLENRSSYQQENHETSISDHDHSTMAGVLEMQNLIAKVQPLQKLIVDDHEKLLFTANLKSVEELKLKESSIREETQGMESLSDHVEKDIRVHKHEISREINESQDEWNRMIIKSLSTDANKLLALQNSALLLKLRMEKSGISQGQNRLQFDTLREKLKEAEAAIFDLLDRNGKSTMMAELYTNLCSGEEMGRAERGEVLEQVQNGSKRIEMVELELEKIDYIFLKLEDECDSYMTRGGNQTPRMLLRDYLFGRRHGKGKKRGLFCLCARPRTLD